MDYRAVPAFCINLDTRPDRWAQAATEFARIDWPVTRQPGVVHVQSPYPALDAPPAGCLDSHKAVWRHCVSAALPVVAVFEDDVLFPWYFKDIYSQARLQLPPDWGAWLLHSFHARCRAYSRDLVRITGGAWGTHGYLVTQQACTLLLELPDVLPADGRLTTQLVTCSSVFGTARTRPLAVQRGDDSDIPRTAQVAFWRRQRQRFCR
jgi:GR25 family glycosyltransferase involved in LPS biosynthesis